MNGNSERVKALEENVAQLRGEYANSWALHTKDDFEMGFAREIKSDLQSTLLKWAVGAVLLLLGAGALFIKYSVSDTFRDENDKLVKDFYRKYEAQLDMLQDRFEWRRFHDYGKDYVYLAQLYFDSPVINPIKVEKVSYNIREADKYFRSALQHGDMHASTYWELAELRFTYPQKLDLPAWLDPTKAITYYNEAALRYTPIEIDKGWRAEVYFKIGEVHLYLANHEQAAPENLKLAREFLEKAKADYRNLKDPTSARDRENIERLDKILEDLAKRS